MLILSSLLGAANSVNFPSLCLQDGPLGIRFADNITAFPAGITTGATWNRDLMYQRGRAHGLEARLKGVNVLLGPVMGPLGRMPAGGRNWEGFGADPVLQGIAASETIRGIQDEGVIATAKHYVLNEQEHFRQSFEWGLPNAMSANIDDRTLHELYVWPFAESVRAGVGSIMCSYQMVNNSYACGNSKILNGILKDELGFQGFVQSDWLAQRGGVSSALAGLDITMPGDGWRLADGNSYWGSHLTKAVLNGSLPIERINDMATRVVATWYQMGQDKWTATKGGPNFSSWTKKKMGKLHQGSPDDDATGVVNKFVDAQGKGKDAHKIIARQVAAEGIVLVKNENNTLPLLRDGGDSIKDGDWKYHVAVYGEDAGPGQGPNACADRGCNQGTLASGWGSGAVDFPYLVSPWKALSTAFNPKKVALSKFLSNNLSPTDIGLLDYQDLCIVFANADSGEGYIASGGVRGDRPDLFIQKNGDTLIETVARKCGGGKGSTVVVIHAVGPVILERWIDLPGVKAVLLAHLPGQESGNALADVLFGKVDASGRLPYTIGKNLSDYGMGGQVMYYPNGVIPQQDFNEGLYIDYRHFDKSGIVPRYEFGFGLSYTKFHLFNLTVTTVKQKAGNNLPDPRPVGIQPPQYDSSIPDASTAVFPPGFRKLTKYIYPYLSSTRQVGRGKYPYPKGYDKPENASQAGGGEGGNPSIFDIMAVVNVTVTNVGSRKGKEVIQVYISNPDEPELDAGNKVDFPKKVLRNFEKVELDTGDSQTISLPLTRKDLSYWSTVRQNWVLPTKGQFSIRVGRSSRDLPLVGIY
jgi:beta-glucosidase-like glycosyl hydrolase